MFCLKLPKYRADADAGRRFLRTFPSTVVILEIVPQRVESLATHLYDNAMRYAGAPESGRLSCHNQFGENNEP